MTDHQKGRDWMRVGDDEKIVDLKDKIRSDNMETTLQALERMWHRRHYLNQLRSQAEKDKLPDAILEEIDDELHDPDFVEAERLIWKKRKSLGQSAFDVASALRHISHTLFRDEAFPLFVSLIEKEVPLKRSSAIKYAQNATRHRAYLPRRDEYIHRLQLMLDQTGDRK